MRAPILLAVGLVAFAVRILPVAAHLRDLVGYDEGVYFGASIALTSGLVPYRDFLLLHPPGMPLVLAPFALLGSVAGDDVAFAIARLACMALGAVNAVLVAVVAGRRDPHAGVLAGLLYATWSTAVSAERLTDLHVPQNMLVLVALLVLDRPGRSTGRRAAGVGVLLGVATSIHLWHGVSVAVAAWWLAVRARPGEPFALRRAAVCGIAAIAAFAVVCLPFLVPAAPRMVGYVLLDQLGRPDMGVGTIDRLRVMVGLAVPEALPEPARLLVAGPLIAGGAAAALLAGVATAWRRPWTRPWAVLGLAQLVTLLVTPSFYNDYPNLLAPPATLVLGSGLAMVLRSLARRIGPVPVRTVAGGTFVLLVAVAVLRVTITPVPLDELRRAIAGTGCVSADHPSLLVLTGALRRDIARGCPIVLDPTGVRYDTDRGRLRPGPPSASMRAATGYQEAMRAWYTSGEVALFVRGRSGLAPPTVAAIQRHLPVVRRIGPVTVRSRP